MLVISQKVKIGKLLQTCRFLCRIGNQTFYIVIIKIIFVGLYRYHDFDINLSILRDNPKICQEIYRCRKAYLYSVRFSLICSLKCIALKRVRRVQVPFGSHLYILSIRKIVFGNLLLSWFDYSKVVRWHLTSTL